LYIADYGNNRIRKVDAITGKISTIAGNGSAGYSGDGGVATSAGLNAPTYVCTDRQGNVYISDVNNNVIRKVDVSTGKISTVAGNDTAGFSGDGGLAVNARLLSPAKIFINNKGDLYIADENNDRVRKVSGGYISTIAGGGTGSGIGDGNLSTNAVLSSPSGIYVDTSGALYIADMSHQRIRYVQKPNRISIIPNTIQFNVYPNPSTGIFTVYTNNTDKAEIAIYNVVGTMLYQSIIANHKSQIDLSELPAGIYFVQLNDGENKEVKKIIISR